MSRTPPYSGPLHLQAYLGDCAAELAEALRGAVAHPVSVTRAMFCSCAPDNLARMIEDERGSQDPRKRRQAATRRAKLERHRLKRISRGSSSRLMAVPTGGAGTSVVRKGACRMFALEVNEEAGVVRGFCRRCRKMFLLFDRRLNWGLRRDHDDPPETFAYRCLCGGHGFEVGLGFDYGEDAFDENDFNTVTIAVKCCACEAVALVLDEEAD